MEDRGTWLLIGTLQVRTRRTTVNNNDVRRVVVGAALSAALLGGYAVGTHQHAATTVAHRCEEDQPCWNCKTMGNHICGPSTQVCFVRPSGNGYAIVFYPNMSAASSASGEDSLGFEVSCPES